MKINPMHDRILIQRLEEPGNPEKKIVVVPEIANSPSNYGLVIAVGPGRYIDGRRVPLQVQVGDFVYFGPWHDWEDIGNGQVLIQEDDVRAIREDAVAVAARRLLAAGYRPRRVFSERRTKCHRR